MCCKVSCSSMAAHLQEGLEVYLSKRPMGHTAYKGLACGESCGSGVAVHQVVVGCAKHEPPILRSAPEERLHRTAQRECRLELSLWGSSTSSR